MSETEQQNKDVAEEQQEIEVPLDAVVNCPKGGRFHMVFSGECIKGCEFMRGVRNFEQPGMAEGQLQVLCGYVMARSMMRVG